MKQAAQIAIVLNIEYALAGRIWTEFRNDREQQVLAKKLESAMQEAMRKHKHTAPDEALIPVTAQLTLKDARTILSAFKPWVSYPTDRRVYQAVNDAIKASENQ